MMLQEAQLYGGVADRFPTFHVIVFVPELYVTPVHDAPTNSAPAGKTSVTTPFTKFNCP